MKTKQFSDDSLYQWTSFFYFLICFICLCIFTSFFVPWFFFSRTFLYEQTNSLWRRKNTRISETISILPSSNSSSRNKRQMQRHQTALSILRQTAQPRYHFKKWCEMSSFHINKFKIIFSLNLLLISVL